MDFETMKYYVSTGLWPIERVDKLFEAEKITKEQYVLLKSEVSDNANL